MTLWFGKSAGPTTPTISMWPPRKLVALIFDNVGMRLSNVTYHLLSTTKIYLETSENHLWHGWCGHQIPGWSGVLPPINRAQKRLMMCLQKQFTCVRHIFSALSVTIMHVHNVRTLPSYTLCFMCRQSFGEISHRGVFEPPCSHHELWIWSLVRSKHLDTTDV